MVASAIAGRCERTVTRLIEQEARRQRDEPVCGEHQRRPQNPALGLAELPKSRIPIARSAVAQSETATQVEHEAPADRQASAAAISGWRSPGSGASGRESGLEEAQVLRLVDQLEPRHLVGAVEDGRDRLGHVGQVLPV